MSNVEMWNTLFTGVGGKLYCNFCGKEVKEEPIFEDMHYCGDAVMCGCEGHKNYANLRKEIKEFKQDYEIRMNAYDRQLDNFFKVMCPQVRDMLYNIELEALNKKYDKSLNP